MKNKHYISVLALCVSVALAGCAGSGNEEYIEEYDTPTVDYVERLNVNEAPHRDSFLHQLAMNYRSYALFNARTSNYPDVAELFAQKAVGAFSGERPFPESVDNWQIESDAERFELFNAYNSLMNQLQNNDVADEQPKLAAESQAKFDCWLSAAATGQNATADECRRRFKASLQALIDCADGKIVAPTHVKSQTIKPTEVTEKYYPETYRLNAMSGSSRTREGVIIVNNVNIPENLIKPVPVPNQPPMVINQTIYGGEESQDNNDSFSGDTTTTTTTITKSPDVVIPQVGDEYVKRDEFINMMMAMREELAAINKRLDGLNGKPADTSEKTIIKVQQIPLEPKQRIMEEIFEIRFDFDKAIIKPEYDEIIKKLAATTQANKNVKVSVVGHTDTAGSATYNYALGGRRAESVQKMLIEYGIPSSQIIAVSAGEEDLKVKTPDNTPNAENRRVRVVKESSIEVAPEQPVAPIVVEKYREVEECDDCENGEE